MHNEERGLCILQLLTQADQLLVDKCWNDAKAAFRRALTQEPYNLAAHRGLVQAITQEAGEIGIDEAREREGFDILSQAYQAGLRDWDVVLPLANLHWSKSKKESGIKLVEEYLQTERDASRVCKALREVTVILHSQIPPDYSNILRLHNVMLEKVSAPLSTKDRLNSYLQDDNQDTYFKTGHGEEWLAEAQALWQMLDRQGKRDPRSSYLSLMAEGHCRAGNYSVALDFGRRKLAHFRRVLIGSTLSSVTAQTYALIMAPAYRGLGDTRQSKRAFNLAEKYLDQYDRSLLVRGGSADQIVEPYANVAMGAIRCGDEERALRLYVIAEAKQPGVNIINMFLAGLYLKIKDDRERSLLHLTRAVRAAEGLGNAALSRVQQWFKEWEYFQSVQDDPDFLALISDSCGRSWVS